MNKDDYNIVNNYELSKIVNIVKGDLYLREYCELDSQFVLECIKYKILVRHNTTHGWRSNPPIEKVLCQLDWPKTDRPRIFCVRDNWNQFIINKPRENFYTTWEINLSGDPNVYSQDVKNITYEALQIVIQRLENIKKSLANQHNLNLDV